MLSLPLSTICISFNSISQHTCTRSQCSSLALIARDHSQACRPRKELCNWRTFLKHHWSPLTSSTITRTTVISTPVVPTISDMELRHPQHLTESQIHVRPSSLHAGEVGSSDGRTDTPRGSALHSHLPRY
jgi:hypothetical protein